MRDQRKLDKLCESAVIVGRRLRVAVHVFWIASSVGKALFRRLAALNRGEGRRKSRVERLNVSRRQWEPPSHPSQMAKNRCRPPARHPRCLTIAPKNTEKPDEPDRIEQAGSRDRP